MNQKLLDYPYASQRRVVLGQRYAAATSQSLATLAGMEMFWNGGNAVDAALAMAIALTVVEPTSNGIGGDAFALVWDGQLQGLNGSGKSPQSLTLETFAGMKKIPPRGWFPVTVPGAVSAWRKLWKKWGKLPFEQLFEPAIGYAEAGFPVSPVTAKAWKQAEKTFLPRTEPEFAPFKAVFFPHNRAPYPGEIWKSPDHGATLRAIAASGGESFYQGELAEKIARFATETGGLITTADLASQKAEWVNPIAVPYRDRTVWELPPNTQGLAALMALNILEGFDLETPRESVDTYHRQIEAMKLAFADVHEYTADPRFMTVSVEQLLEKGYGKHRQQLIQSQAIPCATPGLPQGGTVYLATADENLMVSFIQSNYMGFGSGILIPGTGIALHNRGYDFTLQPGHPNQLAPSKRPFHTIIPGFLTQGNQPLGPFGVMGGPMQPQGHLQVVSNLVDYGMNPQAALDAPRWQFVRENRVLLENSVAPEIAQGLAEKGHQVQVTSSQELFGKGQIIFRQGDILVAASEPRSDGVALAM